MKDVNSTTIFTSNALFTISHCVTKSNSTNR